MILMMTRREWFVLALLIAVPGLVLLLAMAPVPDCVAWVFERCDWCSGL